MRKLRLRGSATCLRLEPALSVLKALLPFLGCCRVCSWIHVRTSTQLCAASRKPTWDAGENIPGAENREGREHGVPETQFTQCRSGRLFGAGRCGGLGIQGEHPRTDSSWGEGWWG